MEKVEFYCEICRNKAICKWCGEFESTLEAIKPITNSPDSPIAVGVICKKFDRTLQKQDGFLSWGEVRPL